MERIIGWPSLKRCCLIILLVGVLNSFPTYGLQTEQDVFASIPPEHRERLVERLGLLVDYQIRQEWAKQYDLFSSLRRRAEGKADFIRLSRQEYARGWKPPLLRFSPKSAALVQVDSQRRIWFIKGCAEIREKEQISHRRALVEAYWEQNDWFFSEVQTTGVLDEPTCKPASPLKSALITLAKV